MTDYPAPHALQFRGSRLARALLSVMGWRIHFEGFPKPQGVAVVYAHTSNWDAPLMFLVKWAIGVQVVFWGKASLFNIPLLGAWLRWIGGVPVQRTSSQGVVGAMIEQMQAHKANDRYYWLGLSPEGTRKFTPGWRSGFYRVALTCDVPLLVVTINYRQRVCGVNHFVRLSGDELADMARISEICMAASGLKPSNMAPVQLLAPLVDRKETVVK